MVHMQGMCIVQYILDIPGFCDSAPAEFSTELACLCSIDQMVQKRKNFCRFSAILFPISALTTAVASAKQFYVNLLKYFAEICN